jgi:hypothetical protein
MKKLYYYNFDSERSAIGILQYINYPRISETKKYRRRNIFKSIYIANGQKRNSRTNIFLYQ